MKNRSLRQKTGPGFSSTFLTLAVGIAAFSSLTGRAATELAKINGTTITLEEFEKKYQDNLKFFPANAPSKKDVLDDLIRRELAVQEAKKQGLDKNPLVIEQMNSVLFNAYVNQTIAKDLEKIFVTDDEAKNYYSKYPEIRTSHIFIAVRPGAKAEEVKKARERITKIQKESLKDGTTFAEVAQSLSEGPTAALGGDLDYKPRSALDPIYYNAAVKLKQGAVSGIVQTSQGFHLIKLTAVRPWDETDKAQVKRQVFDERRGELFETLMKKLRSQSKVTVRSELLKD